MPRKSENDTVKICSFHTFPTTQRHLEMFRNCTQCLNYYTLPVPYTYAIFFRGIIRYLYFVPTHRPIHLEKYQKGRLKYYKMQ
jgi:hypothetical protein